MSVSLERNEHSVMQRYKVNITFTGHPQIHSAERKKLTENWMKKKRQYKCKLYTHWRRRRCRRHQPFFQPFHFRLELFFRSVCCLFSHHRRHLLIFYFPFTGEWLRARVSVCVCVRCGTWWNHLSERSQYSSYLSWLHKGIVPFQRNHRIVARTWSENILASPYFIGCHSLIWYCN